MPIPVDRIDNAAHDLLDAIVAGYLAAAVELPAKQYVSPGVPAWDFGDQCDGHVCIYLDRTFGSDGTAETAEPFDYLNVRSAEFFIEIARCVPMIDDAGNAPPVADEEEAASRVLQDPTMIVNSLSAAKKAGNLPGCKGLVVLGWEGLGPDAGWAGGRQRVRWQLTEG